MDNFSKIQGGIKRLAICLKCRTQFTKRANGMRLYCPECAKIIFGFGV